MTGRSRTQCTPAAVTATEAKATLPEAGPAAGSAPRRPQHSAAFTGDVTRSAAISSCLQVQDAAPHSLPRWLLCPARCPLQLPSASGLQKAASLWLPRCRPHDHSSPGSRPTPPELNQGVQAHWPAVFKLNIVSLHKSNHAKPYMTALSLKAPSTLSQVAAPLHSQGCNIEPCSWGKGHLSPDPVHAALQWAVKSS